MEGLQPWCSAALPIIARCCKSCSCEKSPFLFCCWWGHYTLFPSAMTWPWLHGVQCNSCSLSDTRRPCMFLAAHVLCLLISLLHEELRGRPRAFFLKLPREHPPRIEISALHLVCSLCRVVWFEVSVWRMVLLSMSDSDWSCAVLVGDSSRADGSTADLLSEEDREHCWRYLQRKSPVLPGGGWGSLEAIVAVRVDAPQRQLRLCKWLCSVVIQCHFNCISNLKCQLCREKSAHIFLEVHKFTQQLRAWSSRYRDVSFWRESQNWWQFSDYSFVADVEINYCKIGVHTHI